LNSRTIKVNGENKVLITMQTVFPKPVVKLPEVDIPIAGARGYLSQGEDYQIIFMEFGQDVELPEHAHGEQWGIILEGKVDFTIGDHRRTYLKGDRYFIPDGVSHHGHIYAGLTVVEFFNQKDRYSIKRA